MFLYTFIILVVAGLGRRGLIPVLSAAETITTIPMEHSPGSTYLPADVSPSDVVVTPDFRVLS